MTVYLVHEFSDYGLSDLEYSKVFTSLEKAEEYSESMAEKLGYALDISQIELV